MPNPAPALTTPLATCSPAAAVDQLRLAGDHRLVQRRRLLDGPVHRHHVTRADQQPVADRDRVQRHHLDRRRPAVRRRAERGARSSSARRSRVARRWAYASSDRRWPASPRSPRRPGTPRTISAPTSASTAMTSTPKCRRHSERSIDQSGRHQRDHGHRRPDQRRRHGPAPAAGEPQRGAGQHGDGEQRSAAPTPASHRLAPRRLLRYALAAARPTCASSQRRADRWTTPAFRWVEGPRWRGPAGRANAWHRCRGWGGNPDQRPRRAARWQRRKGRDDEPRDSGQDAR